MLSVRFNKGAKLSMKPILGVGLNHSACSPSPQSEL